jgi:hypothetical protein
MRKPSFHFLKENNHFNVFLKKTTPCTSKAASFTKTYILKKTCAAFDNTLKDIVLFFKKLDGSHILNPHGSSKKLSLEEGRKYLPYVSIWCGCHKTDSRWTKPLKITAINPKELCLDLKTMPGTVCTKDTVFFDKKNGFKASVFSKDNEIIIAYGTVTSLFPELSQNLNDYHTSKRKNRTSAVLSFLGKRPEIFEQALAFASKVQESKICQDKKIVVVGQCFGGSQASYVSLKKKIQGYSFNALPLGRGLQSQIKPEALKNAHLYSTHISTQHDWVSDSIILKIFNTFMSFLKITTPKSFGKTFLIPSAYSQGSLIDNIDKTHRLFFNSFIKFLGYDISHRPWKDDHVSSNSR